MQTHSSFDAHCNSNVLLYTAVMTYLLESSCIDTASGVCVCVCVCAMAHVRIVMVMCTHLTIYGHAN